jgi:hypothetical protein
MITASAPVSRTKSATSAGRASGISACFVVADGVTAPIAEVSAATGAASVAQGRAPYFAIPALPADRPVLEQFVADLAVAPEITGELVALYAEQYPRLAIAFVARALKMQRDAALQIEAAAHRREDGGLADLAGLIYAALDILLPPLPDDPSPVVLDIDEPDFWSASDHTVEAWAQPAVTPRERSRP